MPITVYCSECDKTLKVKDDLAGKRVKCPSCGTAIKVPTSEVTEVTVDSPKTARNGWPWLSLVLSILVGLIFGYAGCIVVGSGFQRESKYQITYGPAGDVRSKEGSGTFRIHGFTVLESQDAKSFETRSNAIALCVLGLAFLLCGAGAFIAVRLLARRLMMKGTRAR